MDQIANQPSEQDVRNEIVRGLCKFGRGQPAYMAAELPFDLTPEELVPYFQGLERDRIVRRSKDQYVWPGDDKGVSVSYELR